MPSAAASEQPWYMTRNATTTSRRSCFAFSAVGSPATEAPETRAREQVVELVTRRVESRTRLPDRWPVVGGVVAQERPESSESDESREESQQRRRVVRDGQAGVQRRDECDCQSEAGAGETDGDGEQSPVHVSSPR